MNIRRCLLVGVLRLFDHNPLNQMSRGTTRPIRRKKQTSGRPSIFFIAALSIGVALLLWFFVQMLRHPLKQQQPPRRSSTSVLAVSG
jgi:hypothetical protein